MHSCAFLLEAVVLLGLLQQHFIACIGYGSSDCLVTRLFHTVSALSGTMENIQAEVSDLRRNLQSEREERIKLQVDNVELRQLITKLQADNALLNSSSMILTSNVAQVQGNLVVVNATFEIMKEKLSNLTSELRHGKDERITLKSSTMELLEVTMQLQHNDGRLNESSKAIEEEVTSLKSFMQINIDELAELKNVTAELRFNVASLEEENDVLENTSDGLTVAVAQLKDDVKALNVCKTSQSNLIETSSSIPLCNATKVGHFYLNNVTNELTVCNGNDWYSVTRGCPYNNYEGYCGYSVLSHRCQLIWKHSYLEVGNVTDDMRTFSSFDRPCTDLSVGWCNIANKDAVPGQVQVTAAYHKGQLVYAYRGERNTELGKTWRGAILNNSSKIVDFCTNSNGVPPEPTSDGYQGLTFDKSNPGVYTGNWDTDQYQKGYGDCRWENCGLPSTISTQFNHVQMTVAMYLC
ncbi:uncharacterized protein LOC134187908 isoform X2 [Corticium candelabrum]|uniref:uncharacterized protein LOC134187908 isoform X2 n=1 Tax=Corticium candelabrum TaxID=121492 RepID=UPI002E25E68F|nr:uncharacterized protein LOC134187908 isoform X2 [Corticium candelabrum]